MQLDMFEFNTEENINPPVFEDKTRAAGQYCCYECKRLKPMDWNETKGISGTCMYKTGIFLGTEQACCIFDPVHRKYEALTMGGATV